MAKKKEGAGPGKGKESNLAEDLTIRGLGGWKAFCEKPDKDGNSKYWSSGLVGKPESRSEAGF